MCAPSVNTGPPSLEETRSHLKIYGWLVSVESALNFSSVGVKQSYWGCMVSSVQLVIPTDSKMGTVAPLWKEKGDVLDCNSLRRCYTAVCARQGFSKDQPHCGRILPSLLAGQWPHQSGFTIEKLQLTGFLHCGFSWSGNMNSAEAACSLCRSLWSDTKLNAI